MPPFNRPPMFGPMRPGAFPGGPSLFNSRGLFGGGSFTRGAMRGPAMGLQGAAPKSGGFLSSLFGRSSGAVSAAQGAVGAGSGGSTIGSFVSNTQKVLAAGERIVPIVRQAQQYGPLIKNLPAMWKIYRGMNADSSSDDEVNTEDSTQNETQVKSKESSNKEIILDETGTADQESPTQETPVRKKDSTRSSIPKLFI